VTCVTGGGEVLALEPNLSVVCKVKTQRLVNGVYQTHRTNCLVNGSYLFEPDVVLVVGLHIQLT